jgi:Lipid A 3-O-deacylase (PagL)
MTHSFFRNGRRTIHFTVSFLLVLVICRGRAQDFFSGVRGGSSWDGNNGLFHQAELFGGYNFPCRLEYSKWFLRPAVDASAGWINNGNTSAFVGTIGLLGELGRGRFPITVEAGAAPTILSRQRFPSRDFGDNFEFTSHVGLNWRMTEHFTLGLRVQHMSNGGIAHLNPGLNMGFLSLKYNF